MPARPKSSSATPAKPRVGGGTTPARPGRFSPPYRPRSPPDRQRRPGRGNGTATIPRRCSLWQPSESPSGRAVVRGRSRTGRIVRRTTTPRCAGPIRPTGPRWPTPGTDWIRPRSARPGRAACGRAPRSPSETGTRPSESSPCSVRRGPTPSAAGSGSSSGATAARSPPGTCAGPYSTTRRPPTPGRPRTTSRKPVRAVGDPARPPPPAAARPTGSRCTDVPAESRHPRRPRRNRP